MLPPGRVGVQIATGVLDLDRAAESLRPVSAAARSIVISPPDVLAESLPWTLLISSIHKGLRCGRAFHLAEF